MKTKWFVYTLLDVKKKNCKERLHWKTNLRPMWIEIRVVLDLIKLAASWKNCHLLCINIQRVTNNKYEIYRNGS